MNVTLKQVIGEGLKKASNEFTRAKRAAYRKHKEGRVSQWQLDRWEKQEAEQELKAAAYEVIETGYLLASDKGTLPANVRQIFYQVRPLVLEAVGRIWKKSETFTQSVLQDYLRDFPEETKDWDIVYDARGHFTEPHQDEQIGCGTLEVRSYIQSWYDFTHDPPPIKIKGGFPTFGPKNRFKFALFIEKEGFDQLLDRANIAGRYDLAIFSTKGQTVTAARKLVDELSAAGVTTLIVHDFDVAGLSIAHWLWHSNDRYEFEHEPKVIDLGLRLADVQELGLQTEEQVHGQKKYPGDKFLDWDDDPVSDEEAEIVCGTAYSYTKGGWPGQRVELNALTARQFIEWLEKKLRQAGVKKVVPGKETLAAAWKRAVAIHQARKLITTMDKKTAKAPKDLEKKLRALLKRQPHLSWDSALLHIASKGRAQ
jgi:Topoisomerase 6 subunit A/Spo11, Toprim domain